MERTARRAHSCLHGLDDVRAVHLASFGAWFVCNPGWIPGAPRFDPSFVVLAMIASVEAIFLSTFVLISQNRMAALADRRADLDLHISLLTGHELREIERDVEAVEVLKAIDQHKAGQDA